MIGIDILQQHRRPVDGVDDHVDLAVVEQVAESRAASGDHHRQPGALDRLDVLKSALLAGGRVLGPGPGGGNGRQRNVMEQQRPLGERGAPVVLVHLRVDVAVGREQVEPAVVVVIEEPIAPAHKRNGGLRDAGLVAQIGKAHFAIVMEQHLVVVAEVGNEEVDAARCSRSRRPRCPWRRSRGHPCSAQSRTHNSGRRRCRRPC